MSFESQGGGGGSGISPGGFEFGLQGWTWPEPVPRAITFFLDGSVMVCDQFGRPIRGAEVNGSKLFFAVTPPDGGRDASVPYEARTVMIDRRKVPLATHAQAIAALGAERIDWLTLTRAGIPQLPYDELKAIPDLPAVGEDEIRRIPDAALRKTVLTIRREADDARTRLTVLED